MKRRFYAAQAGKRDPLVLSIDADHGEVVIDGAELGLYVEEVAGSRSKTNSPVTWSGGPENVVVADGGEALKRRIESDRS